MANRVAWLTNRVKIDGKWLVRKPVVKASGLATNRVHHNGRVVEADGTFVLEWYDFGKRQRLPLSSDATAAGQGLRQKTNVRTDTCCGSVRQSRCELASIVDTANRPSKARRSPALHTPSARTGSFTSSVTRYHAWLRFEDGIHVGATVEFEEELGKLIASMPHPANPNAGIHADVASKIRVIRAAASSEP